LARFTLRYVLPLAKLSLLAGLALSGCGGGSGSTTGPTPVTPETETAAAPVASRPAPAPTPAPTSTSTPGQRELVTVSFIAEGPGSVSGTRTGEVGTRGSATATPASGARFLTWAASSSDCPGEMTNPCSFAFAPNTRLVAQFAASAPTPAPAPVPAPVAARPQFMVTASVISTSVVNFSERATLGCVRIDNSACDTRVSQIRSEGTRGTVYAVSNRSKFLHWSGDDCDGQTTPTCSFVYDRRKGISAVFEKLSR
jgi:hypothetical protein